MLAKINQAARLCVEYCHDSRTPLLAVQQFCDQLRHEPSWQPTEVDEVFTASWREIVALRCIDNLRPLAG